MQDFPEVRRLPAPYAAGIGRIIARWAYQEWLLTEITRRAMGVGPKQARLAMRELRAEDHIKTMVQLLSVLKIEVKLPLDELKRDLRKQEDERNLYAHGMWIRDPKTRQLRIWRIRGSWESGPLQGQSKRIKPEPVKRSPADMKATCREMDRLARLSWKLHQRVKAALAAFHRKLDAQKRRGRRAHGRARNRPSPPPPPSLS